MPRRAEDAYARVSLRIKEPLRAQCEIAANKRGVSMNTEIADRLERSFEADQRIEAVFGSREVYGIMRAIAAALNMVGVSARTVQGQAAGDVQWLDDPYAYDQAVRATIRFLNATRPPGEVNPPRRVMASENGHEFDLTPLMEIIGAAAANGVLDAIAGQAATGKGAALGKDLRRDLGHLGDRAARRWRDDLNASFDSFNDKRPPSGKDD